MKKEFITYWTKEKVIAQVYRMPIPRQNHFEVTEGPKGISFGVMIPDGIPFNEICSLEGRKTRVVIEVLD